MTGGEKERKKEKEKCVDSAEKLVKTAISS